MYKNAKRIIDICCAFLALVVFSPVFLIVMLMVKCTSKGQMFFSQKRVGIKQRYFLLYKFRTMRIDTPSEMPTHLLKDPNSFITPIGKFLRKTSLDELPQLWNILKGDMSIVGSRPALWNQQDLIMLREKYNVHSLPPGLTGWAQVNGRDELAIDVKSQYDAEYIKRISFRFDMKIIFMTIMQVFRGKGIVEGQQKK